MDKGTREYLDMFTVNEHGIIQDHGKFEGEPLYVPYFWEETMHGAGEYLFPIHEEVEDDEFFEGESPIVAIGIEPEDVAAFPELEGEKTIYLEESETGFVYHDFELPKGYE